jgi:hypothetical protein
MNSVTANTIVLELGLVLVLIGWLCARILRRQLQARRRHTLRWKDPGKPLDVSTIRPRIEQVRQDCAAVVHAKPSDTGYHQSLLSKARQELLRLAFFRTTSAPSSTLDKDETHQHS